MALLRGVFYLGDNKALALAQEMLGLRLVDGVMGKQTLQALQEQDPEKFSAEYTRRFVDHLGEVHPSVVQNKVNEPAENNLRGKFERNFNSNATIYLNEELERAVAQMQVSEHERQHLLDFLSEKVSYVSEKNGLTLDQMDYFKRSMADMVKELQTSANEKQIFLNRYSEWLSRQPIPVQENAQGKKQQPPYQFNVDAIAKKSTSDIWTIKDQLGYESYAQSIAKMIVDNKAEPPLTISIQAPW